jgi:hypothetical protein
MSYTNVGSNSFYEKIGQKNHTRLFCCHLIQSHFDENLNLNLNLNQKIASTNLEKIDMVLMYGEAFGHSELAQKIYGERILPNARTFINVVQHLRDFGRFEKNKRDLLQQRGDRILVAEEQN